MVFNLPRGNTQRFGRGSLGAIQSKLQGIFSLY
jgi:hypothetical protein